MHDSWKEMATDLKLDNQELASKLRETNDALLAEKREHANTRMSLKFALDKLRGREMSTVPYEVDDGDYECGACCCQLEEDWQFCPGCGKAIDWRNAEQAEGWYAEEGEDYLRRGVYEPLGEAMRA